MGSVSMARADESADLRCDLTSCRVKASYRFELRISVISQDSRIFLGKSGADFESRQIECFEQKQGLFPPLAESALKCRSVASILGCCSRRSRRPISTEAPVRASLPRRAAARGALRRCRASRKIISRLGNGQIGRPGRTGEPGPQSAKYLR